MDQSPAVAKDTFNKLSKFYGPNTAGANIGDVAYLDASHAIHVMKGKVRYYIGIVPIGTYTPEREKQLKDLAKWPESIATPGVNPMRYYDIRLGKDKGMRLTPHRFRDRTFRASRVKFGPHRVVYAEIELISYIRQGWSIRMSNRQVIHQALSLRSQSKDGNRMFVWPGYYN